MRACGLATEPSRALNTENDGMPKRLAIVNEILWRGGTGGLNAPFR